MSDEPNTNIFADEIFADKITATESIEVEQINSKKVVISGEIEAPGLIKSGEAIAPGTATSISSPQPDTLALGTNDEPRVTITGIGSVGVGITNPHVPLHIETATTGAITSLLKLHGPFTSNTGSEGTAIDFGTAADVSVGARIIGTREAAGAKGALRFCTGRESDSDFNDGHMVIDETGNVGIGTDIPTQKLHVYGSGNQLIMLQSTTTANANYN